MKKWFKMIPILTFAALLGTGCSDDDEVKIAPPTIEVGEVALESNDALNATVTVTPSSTTQTWYWKCEETGGTASAFTSVSGNEETQLTFPIELDTDYTLTVYAENEGGQSEQVTKTFNLASENVEGDLVTFEIKNLSAVSVDVEVTKNVKCVRYAIGAVSKYNTWTNSDGTVGLNYNEDTFIESAQRSLNPDESYPFRPYNTSSENGVFTELTLNKASAQDDVNTGLVFTSGEVYVVGVYALDKDGNGTLYTQEFTVPEMDATKGQANVTITMTDEDKTLTSVAATFSADANCAKLITSIVHKSTLDNSNFDEMSEDEKAAFLAANSAQCPQPYTGEFRREFQTAFSPNTEFVVYAIPVDVNGNIGKVTYVVDKTAGVEFTGTGEITAASISQTSYENVNIKLTLNDEAQQVRLFFMDVNNYFLNHFGDDLNWIMYDEETCSHLWTVFGRSEAADITLAVPTPGMPYYIKAVTIDANGGISEVQDIVKLSGEEGETIIMMAEPEEEETVVSFDGTGTLLMEAVDEVNQDEIVSVTLNVTKDANTQKVYRIRVAEGYLSQVEDLVTERFADYPDELPSTVVDVTSEFSGDSASLPFEYMTPYDSRWGGTLIIFVTEDTAGKLKIAGVYAAGAGVQEGY